jgi:hypothetical protein
MDLTESDRTAIAEFIFSYQTDVLIKQDALTVIDVLDKHKLIEEPEKWKDQVNNQSETISLRLMLLIEKVIPAPTGKAIMDEYYGGNFKPTTA